MSELHAARVSAPHRCQNGPSSGPETAEQGRLTRQAFAFLGIGGGAAISYVIASRILFELFPGLPAWLISGALYLAFVPIVYSLHRAISFRSNLLHRAAFPRYVAVQVAASIVAAMVSFVVIGRLGLPDAMGSAIVIVASSLFSFVCLRGWAFAEKGMRV